MAEQYLNSAQVCAVLEQVGCEAMPRPGLCRMNQKEVLKGPSDAGFTVHPPSNTRHSPEGMDQS